MFETDIGQPPSLLFFEDDDFEFLIPAITFKCRFGPGHMLPFPTQLVGSLKMNTTLEYSTRVVQEGDRRCKKSTLNDLAYLTPLRIPLMNPVNDHANNQ